MIMANIDWTSDVTKKSLEAFIKKNPQTGIDLEWYKKVFTEGADLGKIPKDKYAELTTGSVAPQPWAAPIVTDPAAKPVPVDVSADQIEDAPNALTMDKVAEWVHFAIDPLRHAKDAVINGIAWAWYDLVNWAKEWITNIVNHGTTSPSAEDRAFDNRKQVARLYVQNKQEKDPSYNMTTFAKQFQIWPDGHWKKRVDASAGKSNNQDSP